MKLKMVILERILIILGYYRPIDPPLPSPPAPVAPTRHRLSESEDEESMPEAVNSDPVPQTAQLGQVSRNRCTSRETTRRREEVSMTDDMEKKSPPPSIQTNKTNHKVEKRSESTPSPDQHPPRGPRLSGIKEGE